MNNTIVAPTIEYGTLAPLLLIFGAAIVGVLVEAFAPRYLRKAMQVPITLLSIAGAFALVILQVVSGDVPTTPVAMGALAVDGPSLFIWGVILVLSFVCVLLINDEGHFVASAAAVPGSADEEEAERSGSAHTEVYPLALFAIGGMLLFPAANDLLTMFVGLEVMSLPLYLLCGLARRRRLLSQEASMKYFLLGAFSSAFFLYGTAMIYGYAGTVSFAGISQAMATGALLDPLLLLGFSLLAVGLLFKLGAAPFQAWKPDVYQGAPTPITALMASGTLVAAVGALLRVFWAGLGNLDWNWRPVIWVIAALTMIIGSILAITQTDIKRMLAYSSIAHAGFLLVGVVATSSTAAGNAISMQAILFYLLVYGLATVGAFAVVTLVRDPGGEANHLSRWAGLGKRVADPGGRLRLLPAGLRRDPADQRLLRQVRRVHGGPGQRQGSRRLAGRLDDRAGRGGRRRLGDRGVLLRPRHRADVLQRAGGGRTVDRDPQHGDRGGHLDRDAGYGRSRGVPGARAPARPQRRCRPFHQIGDLYVRASRG